MYTILALALLTNSYDMIGDPIPAQSLVMIGCAPVVKPLLEEEDEKPAISTDVVVVYLNLDDRKLLARIAKDCDSVEGLQFSFRDRDRIPAEGRRYLAESGKKLPLLQYHTDSGWKFSCGWDGAFKFAQRWTAGNSSKEIQTHNQDISVEAGQRRNTNSSVGYPIRGSWWTGCSGWQHLTHGAHASANFNHAWLQSLSNPELQSLHSDHHEELKGEGRVHWSYVNRPVAQGSSSVVVSKPKRRVGVFGFRSYSCPSGNCPWN